MLLNSIQFNINELITHLEIAKAVGIERLKERGVTASLDESIRELFERIAEARENAIHGSDGSGVQFLTVEAVYATSTDYSFTLGFEIPAAPDTIAGTITSVMGITYDVFTSSNARDASRARHITATTIEQSSAIAGANIQGEEPVVPGTIHGASTESVYLTYDAGTMRERRDSSRMLQLIPVTQERLITEVEFNLTPL